MVRDGAAHLGGRHPHEERWCSCQWPRWRLDGGREAGLSGGCEEAQTAAPVPSADSGSRDMNHCVRVTGRDGAGAGGSNERGSWTLHTGGLGVVRGPIVNRRSMESTTLIRNGVNAGPPSVNSTPAPPRTAHGRRHHTAPAVGNTGTRQKHV